MFAVCLWNCCLKKLLYTCIVYMQKKRMLHSVLCDIIKQTTHLQLWLTALVVTIYYSLSPYITTCYHLQGLLIKTVTCVWKSRKKKLILLHFVWTNNVAFDHGTHSVKTQTETSFVCFMQRKETFLVHNLNVETLQDCSCNLQLRLTVSKVSLWNVSIWHFFVLTIKSSKITFYKLIIHI